MVGILFSLRDLKWIVRLTLIGFYSFGLLMHGMYQHDFFGYLVRDHMSFTLFLSFMTAIAFLPFIVPKPKRKIEGGEVVTMKKFHVVIIVIMSFLVTLSIALMFYTDEAKAWLSSAGGGLGASIVSVFSGFNTALKTYEPYQVLLVAFIGGVGFTYVLANTLIPVAKAKIRPVTTASQTYRNEPSTQPTTIAKTPAKTVTAQEETKNE